MNKEQKEQFVSGLLGGSIEEIYKVTSISLTSYLLFKLLDEQPLSISNLFVDYALNVLCLLLSVTVYANQIQKLHLLIGVPIIGALVWRSLQKKKQPKPKETHYLPRKPFITAYRALMLIITNISILAVDFKIFPRRFAKVETWGTSLMDLGVGSFVFSMGLVNSRSLLKNKNVSYGVIGYSQLVSKSVLKAFPLLLLGLVRCLSVKTLEYQEHVTEYGIHWNFFFTLGLLPIILAVLDPILTSFPRAIVALAVTSFHEYAAMNRGGGLLYVLRTDNRMDSLISMNKEGIFSFPGYLSIFIFGQSFGSFVLTGEPSRNNLFLISLHKKGKSFFNKIFTVSTTTGLVITSIVYQLGFYYVNNSRNFPQISRRTANLPYVLWVVSFNAVFLLGYNLVDRIAKTEKPLRLMEAINNNGLGIFLLGNLLTGLINMSINTLAYSDAASFGILVAYAAAFCGIALWFDSRGIYIKV